jgi:prephenate dehydrogenase
MAGKETQGIDAADADLFRGKTWVVTPGVDAPEQAVQVVLGLAETCGAKPLFMDADEHDSYVAAISHLPLTVASVLFSMAFSSAAWPELAQLASSGFRDTTRLASGSVQMSHDISMTNRDNLLHWIDRFQQELSRFREAVASGESAAVMEAFGRSQLERDNYMLNGPPKRNQAAPIETPGLGEMLFGSWLSGQFKKQQDIIRDAETRGSKP